MRYFFHVMNGEALIDEVGAITQTWMPCATRRSSQLARC